MEKYTNIFTTLNLLNKEIIELLDKHEMLEVLIRKEILNETLSNIEIEDNLIESTKSSIIKKNNLQTENDFELWLKNSGNNLMKFEIALKKTLQLNKYSLDNFSHKTEALFLKKQDELDFVTYSLIRVSEFCLANELYMRINEGEMDFGEIASKYSTGPEKNTKGLIGPLPVAKGHPIIKKLIRMSQIKEPTEPVQVGNSYIIFQLESLKKSKLDNDMKLELSKTLFEEWLIEEANLIIGNLKLKYEASTQKT